MSNFVKNVKSTLFSATLLLLLFVPAITGHSAPKLPLNDVTCPAPDVRLTSKTSTTVTFTWDAVSGAEMYKICCVCKDNNSITYYTTNDTFKSIPLAPGTYCFYFCTTCSSGDSNNIIIDDVYMQH